jgi:MFS family permease
MLLALVIVTAIGELFYFLAYHAYFAVIGDTEHRGKQVSVREAVVAVAGIVGPLIGAWALVTVGPGYAFAAVGLVQALAVVPLLGLPNVAVEPSAPGAYRAAWLGGVLYAVDGWFDAFFMTFWQIALFVTLGESIPAYGGAMAIAGLAGALGGLVLGRSIDAGGGRRMAAIGFGAMGLVVVAQAISLSSPILAVVANALAALAMPLMIPSIGTATYNMAKASPCAMRFSMVAEAGWDVGGVAGCLAAAGLVVLDVSPAAIMLFALPALGLGVVLVRRYFGSLAAVAASDRG